MPLVLTIVNDGTGDKDVASYDWTVCIQHGGGPRRDVLAYGRVEDFAREEGWRVLMGHVFAEIVEQGEYER